MIDIQAYLAYGLELTSQEREYRTRFMEWLPDEIIDCHAHAGLPDQVGELDSGIFHHMMSTFPYFSIQDSQQLNEVLYPHKKVFTLRFPMAFRGIHHRAANEYLLKESPQSDRVALYGIPDDVEYTIEHLQRDRVVGLKMYYQYFNPPATTIYQNFPPPILEVAQSKSIPIILHLPKMITLCLPDLERLLQDFPRIPVVLAHLGLPHLQVPELMAAYQVISQYPNVWMDTSMIPSAEVVFMAIQAFGTSRIMYGSDAPLNIVRSRVFNHPTKGQRLITAFPYHWVDSVDHETYQHLAQDLVHTHWQVLEAIQSAIVQLSKKLQTRAIEAIFFANAKNVFRF